MTGTISKMYLLVTPDYITLTEGWTVPCDVKIWPWEAMENVRNTMQHVSKTLLELKSRLYWCRDLLKRYYWEYLKIVWVCE